VLLVVVVVVPSFLPSFLAPSFHQKTGENSQKKRVKIPKKIALHSNMMLKDGGGPQRNIQIQTNPGRINKKG
jgi:hypothetical protein